MVSEYTVKTRLAIPRDILWRAITSNTRIFMDHLVNGGALNRMDATPVRRVDGGRPSEKTRKQVYVPKTIEIPDMVKSVFDDSYLEIEDVQKWDDNEPYQLYFEIMPGVLGDFVKMSGVTSFECSDGNAKECVQTIRGTCSVGIPFVGWYVEQAIIQNMNTFYDAYPAHISNFVTKLLNEFAGSTDALLPALERMEQQQTSNDKLGTPNIVQEGSTNAPGFSADDVNVPGRPTVSSSYQTPSDVDPKFNAKPNVSAANALHNEGAREVE